MFWKDGVNPSIGFKTLKNECQREMTLFWRMLHDGFSLNLFGYSIWGVKF